MLQIIEWANALSALVAKIEWIRLSLLHVCSLAHLVISIFHLSHVILLNTGMLTLHITIIDWIVPLLVIIEGVIWVIYNLSRLLLHSHHVEILVTSLSSIISLHLIML